MTRVGCMRIAAPFSRLRTSAMVRLLAMLYGALARWQFRCWYSSHLR